LPEVGEIIVSQTMKLNLEIYIDHQKIMSDGIYK
jgi:hypothetical protein